MIPKTGLDAMRALGVLADLTGRRFAGVGAVARHTGASPLYLVKVLRSLERRGIVDSRKGKGGGFRLGKAPKEIPIRDVLDPIRSIPEASLCLFKNRPCPGDGTCNVRCRWRPVRRAFDRFLRGATVADFAVVRSARHTSGATKRAAPAPSCFGGCGHH